MATQQLSPCTGGGGWHLDGINAIYTLWWSIMSLRSATKPAGRLPLGTFNHNHVECVGMWQCGLAVLLIAFKLACLLIVLQWLFYLLF